MSNQEQKEYWNEQAGPKWVAKQEYLDANIGGLGLAMLDRAGPAEGETVLDVGCGCGGTTLEIARRVGPAGLVTGLDLSAPMLEHAGNRAREASLDNASFIQGDAQIHALEPGSYDLVASRFGIMFFEDPVAAFTNLRKALKPGGRLAFICWRPLKENAWMLVPIMAAGSVVELPPPPDPEAPGPFAFADSDRARRVLSEAGFTDIEIQAEDQPTPLENEGGLDSAVEMRFEIGPLSRLMEEATPEQRVQVRQAVRDAMEPYFAEGGPTMDFAAWIVTARNKK